MNDLLFNHSNLINAKICARGSCVCLLLLHTFKNSFDLGEIGYKGSLYPGLTHLITPEKLKVTVGYRYRFSVNNYIYLNLFPEK